MNKVILLGNLGANPELRATTGGTSVCTMRLATNRKFKGKDGQLRDDVQWHRVVVWGKQAENCKAYLIKGRKVCIEGRLQTRAWEDKDGKKRYTTEVVASNVQFLSSGNQKTAEEIDQQVDHEDEETSMSGELVEQEENLTHRNLTF